MARALVRKTVSYDEDNFNWLEEHYPGQHWWIMNMLLDEFRRAVGDNGTEYYVRLGAKELASKLSFDPESVADEEEVK